MYSQNYRGFFFFSKIFSLADFRKGVDYVYLTGNVKNFTFEELKEMGIKQNDLYPEKAKINMTK